MAQKALKTLATKNTATLNRTHLITIGILLFYNFLRLTLVNRKLTPYILLSLPAFLIEFWFDRVGRPTYTTSGPGSTPELKRAGEDLEAKGLTEWMWDVIYWTWGCTVVVAVAGDWAWWLYLVVPVYSGYLAVTTFMGVRQGLGGLGGGVEGSDGKVGAGGQSKRQAKMEKRGDRQKVQFR